MAIYESTPPIVTNGLVLALDAANPKSYTPSENLLTYSNDFTNSVWTSGNVSITSSAAISPDGTQNATLIKQDTANNRHVFYNRTYPSTISGSLYTLSFFVKPAGTTKLFTEFQWMGSQYSNAYFDVSTKTKITGGLTPSYVDYPNGWTRVIITGTASTSSTATTNQIYPYICLLDNSGSLSYTGDGTSGAYFYGFQMESNAFVTDYKNTTSSPIFRTTWTDLSGNNNNGTLTNGPTFSSTNGGSIVFDGSDDYANCGTSVGNFGTSNFTINFFFKTTTNSIPCTFIAKSIGSDPTSNYGWLINNGSSANNLGFAIATVNGSWGTAGSYSIQTSGANIRNGIWQMATVVGDRTQSNIFIYLNGISQTLQGYVGAAAFSTVGNVTNNEILAIASESDSSSPFRIAANIAQVSIYNRALSVSEVLQNYNALKNRFNLG